MPTSTINSKFEIKDKKSAERIAAALEKDEKPVKQANYKHASSNEEFARILGNR